MSNTKSNLSFSNKRSIDVPFKAEDCLLFSDKDFFIFEDISLSLDINLTDKKRILKLTFTENCPTFLPFKSTILIHDNSHIIISKTSSIEKQIELLEKPPSKSFYLGIKPEFLEKLNTFKKNEQILINFTFEIKLSKLSQISNNDSNAPKDIAKNDTKTKKEEAVIKTNPPDKTVKTAKKDQTVKPEMSVITDKKQATNNKAVKSSVTEKNKPTNSNNKIEKPDKTVKTVATEKINKTQGNDKSAQIYQINIKNVDTKVNNDKEKLKHDILQNEVKNCQYNGIYNQGATCYINSTIQTLFFIPYFRDVVFHIKSFKEGTIESELQFLFYNLERGKSHCNTKKLTKALGMTDHSVHIQQDIQEFLLYFIEKVQNILQNDQNLKDKISYIFEGQLTQIIKSDKGVVLSSNAESFKQLMINVSSSIESSLINYFKSEKIDNYLVENQKSQTVTLESTISILPRILQIVIKRYKKGSITSSNEKDNSKVVFKEDLDLSPFIEKNCEKCSKYKLFAVIVHRGTISSGHYSVYLKPEMKNDWFYFSDSAVCKSSFHEAVEMNFGGSDYSLNNNLIYNGCKSAYILVYVRIDSIHEMFNIEKVQIPKKMIDFVEKEQQKESMVKKSDPSYLIDFQIFNELCLIENSEKVIMSFYNYDYLMNISVDLRSDVDDIYENISLTTKIESNRLRLWTISNDNLHLDKVISPIGRVDQFNAQKLFLEIKDENEFVLCNDTKIFFVFLYTQLISKPLIFLQPFHYNSNSILKYKTIIGDGIKLINQYLNSNFDKTKASIFVYNTKISKKLNDEICNELNGTMMILQTNEKLNEFAIEIIEQSILNTKKLNQIKILNNNNQRKQKNSSVFNYFKIMLNDIPNSFDQFISLRINTKRVIVYSFENITRVVGIIDVPIKISYKDLIQFIQFVLKIEYFNGKDELILLFNHDKELGLPSKKPIDQLSSLFSNDLSSRESILYYSIVSRNFASDPTSKTRVVQLSKDGVTIGKIVCYYWPESEIHPFDQFYIFNELFFNDKIASLNRIFIVDKNKDVMPFLKDVGLSFDNENVLRIEKVSHDQIGKELVILQKAYIGKHDKIVKFDDPFFFTYIENENVSDFNKRLCNFIGYGISNFKIHPQMKYAHKQYFMQNKIYIEKWRDNRILYLIYENDYS